MIVDAEFHWACERASKEKGGAECAQGRLEKVKVLIGADNKPANKLYLKCRLESVGQIDNHSILSNIYVAKPNAKQICTKFFKRSGDIFVSLSVIVILLPSFVFVGYSRFDKQCNKDLENIGGSLSNKIAIAARRVKIDSLWLCEPSCPDGMGF